MERPGGKKDGKQKGIAPQRYDDKFKEGAIRLVTEHGRPSKEVAAELGICIDTLRNWLKAAGAPSPGQADRQNRDAKKSREFCVDELCRILEVSRGGYYAWAKRSVSPQKQRTQEKDRRFTAGPHARRKRYHHLGLCRGG